MRKPSPRTFAFATMYVGMGSTLAGNAATADWNDPIAVAIAAFPAAALFVTFEMVMRGPAGAKAKTLLARVRTAVALAAVIACGFVSVGHLLELAHAHGQSGLSAWIIAVLPDLMMVLAATVLQQPAPARRPAPKRKTTATRTRKTPAPITADAPAPTDLVGRRRAAAA